MKHIEIQGRNAASFALIIATTRHAPSRLPRFGILVLLSIGFMGGCGVQNQFLDTHDDENGEVVLAHTPRNWSFWTELVDSRIARELGGESPIGGYETWDAFWVDWIDANRTGREQSKLYIDYIFTRRAVAGLPRLSIEELE